MRARLAETFVLAVFVSLAWGCSQPQQEAPATETASGAEMSDTVKVDRAVVVLHPTEGNEAAGTVRFERSGGGVHVVLRVEGLPAGEHGFHIHQLGDCSAPDGTSAGGHFNPFDAPHGARDAESRHVGDLGNITADEDGVAEADFTDTVIAFEGEASIVGRGVILHAGADDLTSQPTGAAGARLACGVIGIAGTEN